MDEKIKFEEYGIDFSDEDFDGVSKETLKECKTKIDNALRELKRKEGENNG